MIKSLNTQNDYSKATKTMSLHPKNDDFQYAHKKEYPFSQISYNLRSHKMTFSDPEITFFNPQNDIF